jgi:hypothetical protein
MCLFTAIRCFPCRLDLATKANMGDSTPGRIHTEYTSFFKLKQVEYVSTASLGLDVQPTWLQQQLIYPQFVLKTVNIRWYQRLA